MPSVGANNNDNKRGTPTPTVGSNKNKNNQDFDKTPDKQQQTNCAEKRRRSPLKAATTTGRTSFGQNVVVVVEERNVNYRRHSTNKRPTMDENDKNRWKMESAVSPGKTKNNTKDKGDSFDKKKNHQPAAAAQQETTVVKDFSSSVEEIGGPSSSTNDSPFTPASITTSASIDSIQSAASSSCCSSAATTSSSSSSSSSSVTTDTENFHYENVNKIYGRAAAAKKQPKTPLVHQNINSNSSSSSNDCIKNDVILSTTKGQQMTTSAAAASSDGGFSGEFMENVQEQQQQQSSLSSTGGGLTTHKRVFKMLRNESKLVKAILNSHDFVQTGAHGMDFHLLWTGTHLRPYCYRSLNCEQKVNHFPRSFELTRKDRLYRNIERMQFKYSKCQFDFIPEFYVSPEVGRPNLHCVPNYYDNPQVYNVGSLPRNRRCRGEIESDPISQEIHKIDEVCSREISKALFIVKPVGLSRGRGIFLAQNHREIPLASPHLVSRYISDPYLIGGHKFDIRLYVAVTSIQPLVLYLYHEGLVRLASEKYTVMSRSFSDQCVHLTNYSLNRYSKKYVKNTELDVEDTGHKWTLGAFLRHLRTQNVDPSLVMLRLEDLVVKTMLSVESAMGAATYSFVPFHGNCFELFGFDVLLDSCLKPWLLEVNLSPSLSCDSPLDFKVKCHMLCDLFSLIGIPSSNPQQQKPLKLTPHMSPAQQKAVVNKTAKLSRSKGGKRQLGPQSGTMKAAKHARAQMLKRQAQNSQGKGGSLARTMTIKEQRKEMVDRVISEQERAGGFLRLLPRPEGELLYGEFMEELSSGNEGFANLDVHLHRDMYSDNPTFNLEMRNRIQEQLGNTEKYRNFVSEEVKEVLKLSFDRARKYEQRIDNVQPKVDICPPDPPDNNSNGSIPSSKHRLSLINRSLSSSNNGRRRHFSLNPYSRDPSLSSNNNNRTTPTPQLSPSRRSKTTEDVTRLLVTHPRELTELMVPIQKRRVGPPSGAGGIGQSSNSFQTMPPMQSQSNENNQSTITSPRKSTRKTVRNTLARSITLSASPISAAAAAAAAAAARNNANKQPLPTSSSSTISTTTSTTPRRKHLATQNSLDSHITSHQ